MIYLKLEKQPESVEELLNNLLSYKTSSEYKSCATYSDKECTKLECKENKYRSADDIVIIVKTYFPDLEEGEIFKHLLSFTKTEGGFKYYPYLIHCPNISRPTIGLYRGVNQPYGYFENTSYTNLMHKSKYKDWAEIASLAGINSFEELVNIHKCKHE